MPKRTTSTLNKVRSSELLATGFILLRSHWLAFSSSPCPAFLILRSVSVPSRSTIIFWRWRQHLPPKIWHISITVHGVTSQKTLILIFRVVGTSDPRYYSPLTAQPLWFVWRKIMPKLEVPEYLGDTLIKRYIKLNPGVYCALVVNFCSFFACHLSSAVDTDTVRTRFISKGSPTFAQKAIVSMPHSLHRLIIPKKRNITT